MPFLFVFLFVVKNGVLFCFVSFLWVLLKKKIILTLVKTTRKTLFRTAAVGKGIKPNSEFGKAAWGFTAIEHSGGHGWKVTKRRH